MGTRWQAFFFDGEKHLGTVYGQYDGYPSGAGDTLKTILDNGNARVVNGFNSSKEVPRFFNGIGCLAAHVVASLKEGIGGIYMSSDKDPDNWGSWSEFHYVFTVGEPKDLLDGLPVHVKVLSRHSSREDKVVFNGLLSECPMTDNMEELLLSEDERDQRKLLEVLDQVDGDLHDYIKDLFEKAKLVKGSGDAPTLGGLKADG